MSMSFRFFTIAMMLFMNVASATKSDSPVCQDLLTSTANEAGNHEKSIADLVAARTALRADREAGKITDISAFAIEEELNHRESELRAQMSRLEFETAFAKAISEIENQAALNGAFQKAKHIEAHQKNSEKEFLPWHTAIFEYPSDQVPLQVAWHPTESKMAVVIENQDGSGDEIHIIDSNTGKILNKVDKIRNRRRQSIKRLSFSPDGTVLQVQLQSGSTPIFLDATTLVEGSRLPKSIDKAGLEWTWCGQGHDILVLAKNKLNLFNTTNGSFTDTHGSKLISGPLDFASSTLICSPDAETIGFDKYGLLQIWDQKQPEASLTSFDLPEDIGTMSLSPSTNLIALTEAYSGKIGVFDRVQKKILFKKPLPPYALLERIQWINDSELLVSYTFESTRNSNTFRSEVWNAKTGKKVLAINGPGQHGFDTRASADGSLVVSRLKAPKKRGSDREASKLAIMNLTPTGTKAMATTKLVLSSFEGPVEFQIRPDATQIVAWVAHDKNRIVIYSKNAEGTK